MAMTKERIREMVNEFGTKKVIRKGSESDKQFKIRIAKERNLIKALAMNSKAYQKVIRLLLKAKHGEKLVFAYIQGVLDEKGLALRDALGLKIISTGGKQNIKNPFNRNYKRENLRMKK